MNARLAIWTLPVPERRWYGFAALVLAVAALVGAGPQLAAFAAGAVDLVVQGMLP